MSSTLAAVTRRGSITRYTFGPFAAPHPLVPFIKTCTSQELYDFVQTERKTYVTLPQVSSAEEAEQLRGHIVRMFESPLTVVSLNGGGKVYGEALDYEVSRGLASRVPTMEQQSIFLGNDILQNLFPEFSVGGIRFPDDFDFENFENFENTPP